MTLSNSTSTHAADFMLSVSVGTIGGIGVPGNLILILLILSETKKRKPHEWCLFALAVVDFALCLNVAALEAPFLIEFYDSVWCKIGGVLNVYLTTLSFFTPPLVAFNRYLCLCNQAKYTVLFTNRKVLAAFVVYGLVVSLYSTPFLATGNIGKSDTGLCGMGDAKTRWQSAGIMALILTGLASYFSVMYFSYKVIKVIRKQKHDVSQSQIQSRVIRETSDLIKVILIGAAIPLFAQLPAVLVKLFQALYGPPNVWVIRGLTSSFPIPSALNPYVTVYVVREYRKVIIKWIRRGQSANTTQVVAIAPRVIRHVDTV